MRKRTIGLATAIGGVFLVGGLVFRSLFFPPSDFKDATNSPVQITVTTPESTPELKYDVVSSNLEEMLFEEEDIPRVVNNRVLDYRSHIQSDHPTQCVYPQLEKRDLRVDAFGELLLQSSKVCARGFSIELLERQYGITTGLVVYNSVEEAKRALSSYITKMKEECATDPQGTCPKMKDFIVQHPTIGNESILFANVPGQDENVRVQTYFLHFRRYNFIGYVIGVEPSNQLYLDLNSMIQMGETLNSRINQ